jgi:hypothetical protein
MRNYQVRPNLRRVILRLAAAAHGVDGKGNAPRQARGGYWFFPGQKAIRWRRGSLRLWLAFGEGGSDDEAGSNVSKSATALDVGPA